MKYALTLLFLLSGSLFCFSQEKQIKFTDGSQMRLPVNPVDYTKLNFSKVNSFKVTEKTAIGFFGVTGKARPLDLPGKLSAATFKKNAKLFAEIEKITTEGFLKQNSDDFNIHCLNSVHYDKLLDCNDCEVKVGLVIMEFGIGGKNYFVPLIKSVEKFRVGKSSEIKFDDETTLDVIPFYNQGTDARIEQIAEKDFTAEFKWTGLASAIFSSEIYDELRKRKPVLARQIKNSADIYGIAQNGQTFNFPAFRSVNKTNFRNCSGFKPCRIKCRAVIVTINGEGAKKNILIIESIRKIN